MPLDESDIPKENDDSTMNQIHQQSKSKEKNEESTAVCLIEKEPQLECSILHSISEDSACQKISLCEKDFESKALNQILVKHMLGSSYRVSNVCVINENNMIVKILPNIGETWDQRCNLDTNKSKEHFIHISKLPDNESKEQELFLNKVATCYLCMQHKVKLQTLQPQNTASVSSIWNHNDLLGLKANTGLNRNLIYTTMQPKIQTVIPDVKLSLQKSSEAKVIESIENQDNSVKPQKTYEAFNKRIRKLKKKKKSVNLNLKDENAFRLESTDSENSYTCMVRDIGNLSTFEDRKLMEGRVFRMSKNNDVSARKTCNNTLTESSTQVSATTDKEAYISTKNKEENGWEPKKNHDPIIVTSKDLRAEELIYTPRVNMRKYKTVAARSHIKHFENNSSSCDISKLYSKKNEMQTQKVDSQKRIKTKNKRLRGAVQPVNSTSFSIDNKNIKISTETNKIESVSHVNCESINELQNTSSTSNYNSLSSEIKVHNRSIKHCNSSRISEIQAPVSIPVKTGLNQKVQDPNLFQNKEDQNINCEQRIEFASLSCNTKKVVIPANTSISDRCLQWENKLGVINTTLSKNSKSVLTNNIPSFYQNLIAPQEVVCSTSKIYKTDSELIGNGMAQNNKSSIYSYKQTKPITNKADNILQEIRKTNSRSTEFLSSAYIELRPNVRTDSRSVIKLEKEVTGKTTETPNSVTMKERCSELEKKFDNMRKTPLKGAKVVGTQMYECSNSFKSKIDANTYNSKKQIPKNTETKESIEASNKTFKSILLTDNSSLNNISCSSVKHDVNSVLKYQNEQKVMFEAIPEKSKIGPNIRERCLEWEERIRLANSCESRDNKAHDSISESCSNLKFHRIDSDINCNKLIVKTEFPGITVSNTEKKSKSPRPIGFNTTMLMGTKSKKNMTHERDPNYINVVNESGMNLPDSKNDLITQGFTQHRTDEIENLSSSSSHTTIVIEPSPLSEPFLNSSRRKRYEPLIESRVKTPTKHLRMNTRRNSKTTPKNLENTTNFIGEGVTLENEKKITRIAPKEHSSRSPTVHRSSKFSIFHCFCNLFHKRHKRCCRSYKKIYAEVNKTYFINWVLQEVDGDTGCKHCCWKRSTIKRSISTYF